MPRQELNITTFRGGMVNNVDSEDMPSNTTMYSVNVDATAMVGAVQGVKDSVDVAIDEDIVKALVYETETQTSLATIDALGTMRFREGWDGHFPQVGDENTAFVGTDVSSVQSVVGNIHLGNVSKIAILDDDELAVYPDRCAALNTTAHSTTSYPFFDGVTFNVDGDLTFVGLVNGNTNIFTAEAEATGALTEISTSFTQLPSAIFYGADGGALKYFFVITGENTFTNGVFNGTLWRCTFDDTDVPSTGNFTKTAIPIAFVTDEEPTYSIQPIGIKDIKVRSDGELWMLLGGEDYINPTSFPSQGELRLLYYSDENYISASTYTFEDKTPGFTKKVFIPSDVCDNNMHSVGDTSYSRSFRMIYTDNYASNDSIAFIQSLESGDDTLISLTASSQRDIFMPTNVGWDAESTVRFYIPLRSLQLDSSDLATFPVIVESGLWVQEVTISISPSGDTEAVSVDARGLIEGWTVDMGGKTLFFTVEDTSDQTVLKTYDNDYEDLGDTISIFSVIDPVAATRTEWRVQTTVKNTGKPAIYSTYYDSGGSVFHYTYAFYQVLPSGDLARVNCDFAAADGGTAWAITAISDVPEYEGVPAEMLSMSGRCKFLCPSATHMYISQQDELNTLYRLIHAFTNNGTGALVTITGTVSLVFVHSDSTTESPYFTSDVEYVYKVAGLYDGFQEGGLSAPYVLDLDPDGSDPQYTPRVIVTLEVVDNEAAGRLDKILLFRSDDGGAFRLVATSPFPGLLTPISLVDDFSSTASFDSLAGYSETLTDPYIENAYSHFYAGYMFSIGKGKKRDVDISRYLFRSIAGKPSIYDYTKDYAVMPFLPIAVTSFNGRIIVMGKDKICTVDPDGMYIDRVETGLGIGSISSFTLTPVGVFMANQNNVWLYDGFKIADIGSTIKGNRTTISPILDYNAIQWNEKVFACYSSKDDLVFFSCIINSASMAYPNSAGIQILLSYSLKNNAWELLDPVSDDTTLTEPFWVNALFADNRGGVFCSIDYSPNTIPSNLTYKKISEYEPNDV